MPILNSTGSQCQFWEARVLNANIEKYEAFKELTHDHASNSSSIEIELNNLNSNNPIVPVENADELDILIKMERANK